jgi:hypothetical protein
MNMMSWHRDITNSRRHLVKRDLASGQGRPGHSNSKRVPPKHGNGLEIYHLVEEFVE